LFWEVILGFRVINGYLEENLYLLFEILKKKTIKEGTRVICGSVVQIRN
jgi:hypothetical protein